MTTANELLAACEERVGDRTQLLVTADFFAENDNPKWERVMRWMAEYDKHPYRSDPSVWTWTCYGGLCGERFNCGTAHALPNTLRKRMGFREWKSYYKWVDAVEALATALEEGWVECVGDPTQVEPEAIAEMEAHSREVLAYLQREGLL